MTIPLGNSSDNKDYLDALSICNRLMLFGNEALLYIYLYCNRDTVKVIKEFIYLEIPISDFGDFLHAWLNLERKGLMIYKKSSVFLFKELGAAFLTQKYTKGTVPNM